MKATKFFLMALAAGSMLAACNKAEESNVVVDNTPKSVEIKVANKLTAADGFRSSLTDFTADGTVCASEADLYVFFLNSSGAVVGEPKAFATATDVTYNATTENYTFHLLDPAVNSVFITNKSNWATGRTVAEMKANVANAALQQGAAELLVWGEKGLTPVGEENHPGGVKANTYTCTVSVAPKVAKVEVGNFECTDVASSTKFNAFTFVKFGLYYPATYTPDAAGLTAWNAKTTGWDVDTFTANTNKFTYTFADGAAVPQFLLELNGTNAGTPVLANPYYVISQGFKSFTGTLQAGNIYRLSFKFADENIQKWNPQEVKCVEVAVDIAEWKVLPQTPSFE